MFSGRKIYNTTMINIVLQNYSYEHIVLFVVVIRNRVFCEPITQNWPHGCSTGTWYDKRLSHCKWSNPEAHSLKWSIPKAVTTMYFHHASTWILQMFMPYLQYHGLCSFLCHLRLRRWWAIKGSAIALIANMGTNGKSIWLYLNHVLGLTLTTSDAVLTVFAIQPIMYTIAENCDCLIGNGWYGNLYLFPPISRLHFLCHNIMITMSYFLSYTRC